MRIIKFRGKRADNGEWVYGSFVYDEQNDEYYIWRSGEWYKVLPETIGQYTTIDDCKGYELYAGDLFNMDFDMHRIFEICYEFGCFTVHENDRQKGILGELDINYIEKFGNIFENPELIKTKKP